MSTIDKPLCLMRFASYTANTDQSLVAQLVEFKKANPDAQLISLDLSASGSSKHVLITYR